MQRADLSTDYHLDVMKMFSVDSGPVVRSKLVNNSSVPASLLFQMVVKEDFVIVTIMKFSAGE